MEFSNQDIDMYLDLGNHDSENSQVQPQQSNDGDFRGLGEDISQQSQILLSNSQFSKYRRTTEGSQIDFIHKKQGAKEATAKYRERRKKYVQQLEENVKDLEAQIKKTEQQITNVKDSIVEKLMTASKSIQSSQNAEIFNELETLVQSGQAQTDVDIDKVNLLLDTLKYRIGPTGRERQAKLTYNFNNIINTLFPGLHRYFMSTSVKKLDFYKQQTGHELSWTKQLMNRLQLTPEQQNQLKSLKNSLSSSHSDVVKQIQILLSVKDRLKQEALRFNQAENQFRECMNPIQCGRLILWCQKNKYHQDIFLQKANLHFYEDETLEVGIRGRKRVHRSS